jgi:hypothetical protein
MASFSLPATESDNEVAFSSAEGAALWLEEQFPADSTTALTVLVAVLSAYNAYATPPYERFRVLETLRKTVFSVCRERTGFPEHGDKPPQPLPLVPEESEIIGQLWRASAVGYLHCLAACQEGDPQLVEEAARLAHRALTSLRMEQLCRYMGGAEVSADFWGLLHAVYASAEALGVTAKIVGDTSARETAESSVTGHYGMALMLHLAQPLALAHEEFLVVKRWLVRWRELVQVQEMPRTDVRTEVRADSCCIALDLAQSAPFHDPAQPAGEGRWLVLDRVLRKIRKRIEALQAGESPESLKLGSMLPADDCILLLELLHDRLRFSPSAYFSLPSGAVIAKVASGLDNLHRLLGDLNATLARDKLNRPVRPSD